MVALQQQLVLVHLQVEQPVELQQAEVLGKQWEAKLVQELVLERVQFLAQEQQELQELAMAQEET